MRLILLSLIVFSAVPLSAGNEKIGTLRGVVRDPYGAVVPGARIVIQSWNSDVKNRGRVTYIISSVLVTDDTGEFSLRLEEGRYDVFISYPIFLPTGKRVRLQVDKETKLDFELKEDPETAGLVH